MALAITNNYQELVTGIKHSVHGISDKCVGKGLITNETHSEISEVTSKSKKARLLLDNVTTTIKIKSGSLEIFAEILENEQSTEHLGVSLRAEFKNIKDRATIAQVQSNGEETPPHQNDSTKKPTFPTSIEESETEEITLRRRKLVTHSTSAGAKEVLYNHTIKDLMNAIKTLQYAELDSKERESQVRALKEDMKTVKEENRALEQEKKEYSKTIRELQDLLQQKDDKLILQKEEIQRLECKVSETERQKHNEMLTKDDLEYQVKHLNDNNTRLFQNMEKTRREKQDLQSDLEKVQKLFDEAKEKCTELETLEASYEEVREELLEELKQEQDTSYFMHMQAQEERTRFLKCFCYAVCLIIAVLIAFVIVIISMAYCLEEKENRNLKQCTQTVLNIIFEYLV